MVYLLILNVFLKLWRINVICQKTIRYYFFYLSFLNFFQTVDAMRLSNLPDPDTPGCDAAAGAQQQRYRCCKLVCSGEDTNMRKNSDEVQRELFDEPEKLALGSGVCLSHYVGTFRRHEDGRFCRKVVVDRSRSDGWETLPRCIYCSDSSSNYSGCSGYGKTCKGHWNKKASKRKMRFLQERLAWKEVINNMTHYNPISFVCDNWGDRPFGLRSRHKEITEYEEEVVDSLGNCFVDASCCPLSLLRIMALKLSCTEDSLTVYSVDKGYRNYLSLLGRLLASTENSGEIPKFDVTCDIQEPLVSVGGLEQDTFEEGRSLLVQHERFRQMLSFCKQAYGDRLRFYIFPSMSSFVESVQAGQLPETPCAIAYGLSDPDHRLTQSVARLAGEPVGRFWMEDRFEIRPVKNCFTDGLTRTKVRVVTSHHFCTINRLQEVESQLPVVVLEGQMFFGPWVVEVRFDNFTLS